MPKPGATGVRPIGIGQAFVQLASGILLRRHREDFRQLIGEHDLSFAEPCGTEALAHAVRSYLAARPGSCVLKIDVENAFNSVDRLAVLRAAARIPGIAPFVAARYGAVATATFRCPVTGRTFDIPVAEGTVQGDPLAGALYCAVQAEAYARTRQALANAGADVHLLTFADDGNLLGHPADVFRAFDILQRELAELGLRVQPRKCQVYLPPSGDGAATRLAAAELRRLAEAAQVAPAEGVLIAGSPVGTDTFVRSVLDDMLHGLQARLRRLVQVLDLSAAARQAASVQGLYRVLVLCMPATVLHLLRTTPPRLSRPFAEEADARIRDAAYAILGTRLPAAGARRQLVQARLHLPVSSGGMGLLSLAEAVDAAYIGSWAACGARVSRLLPGVVDGNSLSDDARGPAAPCPALVELEQALAHLRVVCEPAAEGLRPQEWFFDVGEQPSTTKTTMQKDIREHLVNAAHDAVERALSDAARGNTADALNELRAFTTASDTVAGAWVLASPAHRWARMFDNEYRAAAMLRLGSDDPRQDGAGRCINCNQPFAGSPFHAFSCTGHRHTSGYTYRHNLVRDALAAGARWITRGSTDQVSVEPSCDRYWQRRPRAAASQDDTRARADVGITFGADTRLFDVGITTAPLAGMFRAKTRSYDMRYFVPAGALVPVIFDAFSGAAHDEAAKVLVWLSTRSLTDSADVCLQALRERVSVALHRGSAYCFAHRGGAGQAALSAQQ